MRMKGGEHRNNHDHKNILLSSVKMQLFILTHKEDPEAKWGEKG